MDRPGTTNRSSARGKLWTSVFGVSVLLSCADTEVGPQPNPTPILTGTNPAVVLRGPAEVEIQVIGLGFIESAEVLWNGEPRPTTLVGPTQLSVVLSDADLAAATNEIRVASPGPGGGVSNAVALVVGPPPPVLSGLSTNQVESIFTQGFQLTVTGSNFVAGPPGTRVLWDGVPLVTTFVSPTELKAIVPDHLLQRGRTFPISLLNPPPAGGRSSSLPFYVVNPAPVVTSISPSGVTVNQNSPLEIMGTGFVYGVKVWVEGTELTPAYHSSSRLTVSVPAALAISGTTPSVSVVNPGPGGGLSNAVPALVFILSPVVDSLAPPAVYSGTLDLVLTVRGTDIDPHATATVGGSPRAVTFVNPTRIDVSMLAGDVSAAGALTVAVTNPLPGGGVAMRDLTVVSSDVQFLGARSGETGLVLMNTSGSTVYSVPSVSTGTFVDASPLPGAPAGLFQTSRIFEVGFPAGPSRRVTGASENTALVAEQWGRYSADGEWIYFMGQRGGAFPRHWEIRRIAASGGISETLVSAAGTSYGYPSPSHAGDRVVYSENVSLNASVRLWIYDFGTNASTPLNVNGATSRWTPDDEWIVYYRPGGQLKAIRPDGTGDFEVAPGTVVASGFDISPDGNWIVAATFGGPPILISFPDGVVTPLSGFPSLGSISWFGP